MVLAIIRALTRWVQHIKFDIMREDSQQLLLKIVEEVMIKKRSPGVKRMKLGELWASPCCAAFCKLGPMNKEH